MLRRPPSSTLFPTRRSSDLAEVMMVPARRHKQGAGIRAHHRLESDDAAIQTLGLDERGDMQMHMADHRTGVRSEEHTSELQSRLHLVCRLLLEKKKKKTSQV